jgi:TonB family protein
MRIHGAVVTALLAAAGCAEQKAEGTHPVAADEAATTVQEATVSEERRDAIERLFARKAAELQSCWSDEYERNHNRKLEGDVTVGLQITPSGQPQDVKILHTSLNNRDIETCVVHAVSSWNFPDGQASVPYMRTVHLGAQF